MKRALRWKHLGFTALGVAAGGICFSPVLAQQLAPRFLQRPVPVAQAKEESAAAKEVHVSAAGNFRAVVLTEDGRLVPGAKLTFSRDDEKESVHLVAETGRRGDVLVEAARPGHYRVHVEAGTGRWDGTLRVRQHDPDFNCEPHTVAFTLPCRAGGPGKLPCLPRGAWLALPWLADLLSEEEKHVAPVASP